MSNIEWFLSPNRVIVSAEGWKQFEAILREKDEEGYYFEITDPLESCLEIGLLIFIPKGRFFGMISKTW